VTTFAEALGACEDPSWMATAKPARRCFNCVSTAPVPDCPRCAELHKAARELCAMYGHHPRVETRGHPVVPDFEVCERCGKVDPHGKGKR
jgi:hypothetical protein